MNEYEYKKLSYSDYNKYLIYNSSIASTNYWTTFTEKNDEKLTKEEAIEELKKLKLVITKKL